MLGVYSRFKRGLAHTKESLFVAIAGVLGNEKLDNAAIEQIEEALYSTDFGVETTTDIIDEIRRAVQEDKGLLGKDARQIGAAVLYRILEGAEGALEVGDGRPEVFCLVGANGSGKTTTAAKLAFRLKGKGFQPILGACDTFRAAANEQIQIWADRLGLELISSHSGADAAAVAFDAYEAARSRKRDALILDTAGRLHTRSNLMAELQKIRKVLQKHEEAAPHHSWIVIDGTVGSNSIEQARVFHREFGLTGIVITKLDGTSRGGALVGIYRELKLPIYFVGLGEQAEDLQPFSTRNYVEAILGRD